LCGTAYAPDVNTYCDHASGRQSRTASAGGTRRLAHHASVARKPTVSSSVATRQAVTPPPARATAAISRWYPGVIAAG
jgi:hypothetical protein